MRHTVRVWDLPTRLFHWALVLCVLGLAITGYIPGSWIDWHARLGYAVLALLLFRIVWGFVGGRWSRFAAFFYSPGSVVAYLKGRAHPDHLIGHNPLGAASVFAMLAFLLAQVATGLVSDDEIAFTGPLNRFVSTSKGLAATWYHKAVGQWILLALVLLHIAAILYYLWKKKENLVGAMVHGDKAVGTAAQPSRDDAASRLVALVVFALCAGAVYALTTL
ncbi:MAG TPA: cytochrome b/b6 domain-containing protein [Ramlibacter sp.]|nr:cytochrome b/b6 domain-containing protein [Ramlibacter sp.]